MPISIWHFSARLNEDVCTEVRLVSLYLFYGYNKTIEFGFRMICCLAISTEADNTNLGFDKLKKSCRTSFNNFCGYASLDVCHQVIMLSEYRQRKSADRFTVWCHTYNSVLPSNTYIYIYHQGETCYPLGRETCYTFRAKGLHQSDC